MSILKKSAAALSGAGVVVAVLLSAPALGIQTAPPESAATKDPIAFAIPAEDGYGIADCMTPGQACGAAMATSWCETHGHHKAVAYGLAADVTGTVPGSRPAAEPASSGDVLIRCGD